MRLPRLADAERPLLTAPVPAHRARDVPHPERRKRHDGLGGAPDDEHLVALMRGRHR